MPEPHFPLLGMHIDIDPVARNVHMKDKDGVFVGRQRRAIPVLDGIHNQWAKNRTAVDEQKLPCSIMSIVRREANDALEGAFLHFTVDFTGAVHEFSAEYIGNSFR